jgi:hypothetical protein
LKRIEAGLTYNQEKRCWVAKYPCVHPRECLKETKEAAIKSMLATERSLKRDPQWGVTYQAQIQDMLHRGVVRVVPEEELAAWTSQLSAHLVAINPKSLSTPARLVFDVSRPQGGEPSLNQVLVKGQTGS